MTVTVESYRRLKSKVDELMKDAARAEGAFEAAMARLREHGCGSIEQAEEKLAELKEAEQEAEQAYRRELKSFEDKWGDRLR